MKVAIIGSGNVATHLANALVSANVEVNEIWSYQYKNAKLLADAIGAKAIDPISAIDLSADICLIAIKDDHVAEIATQLKGFKGIVAHTSGAVDLTVFEGISINYGVFYPLQTFSKSKDVSFETIPICLEANNEDTLLNLKKLALKLSKTVVEVNSEKRRILHLSAVFACNFTNHLYAMAEEILAEHQLDFELIRPLILETAAKVQTALPINVQTGPAVRNDEQTMKKHQQLLLQQPQLLEIYKTLSESIKKTKSY